MTEHHLGEDLLAIASGVPMPAEHQAELEAHLRDCVECKAAVAEARRVLEVVDALPTPAPGPAFARSLNAKLDAIDAEREGLWSRIRALFTLPRFVGVAAAMAGLVLAVLLLRPSEGSDGLELAEPLEVAEQLELYEDLDTIENLDVLDDLEVIATLEAEPG